MRINRLHIHRFGILADQAMPALSPGLNCFLGRNEAGKSTCLRFFRSMLFGYRRGSTNLEPMTEKAAKAVAAESGGSLYLGTATEGDLILTRRPGKGGGQVRIARADGTLLPDDAGEALLARLFSGMTVDVFDAIFAFSLKELMEFASFRGSNVRHALHGAAFGQGLRSPAQVLKRLEERMSPLLKERGSAALNNVWHELQKVRDALRDREPEVAQYAALNGELEALDAGLAALRADRDALEAQLRRTRRRADLWQHWEELGRVRAERAELEREGPPAPDNADGTDGKGVAPVFAPDAVQRLDALIARREERQLAVTERERTLLLLDQEIARLDDDAAPDAGAALLARLQPFREQKDRRRSEAESVPALRAECSRLEALQAESLAALGPDWDVARVAGLDLSLASGQSLLDKAAAIRRLTERLDRLKDDCRRLAEELDEAAAQEEEAGRVLSPALPVETELPDKSVAAAVTAAMAEANARLGELPALLERRDRAVAEAARALTDIDPAMTADTLRALDHSPNARHALTGAAAELLAAAARRDETERRLRLAEERAQAALLHVETLRVRAAAHDGLPDAQTIAARQRLLDRLRGALAERATAAAACAQFRSLIEETSDRPRPALPLPNNPLFLAGAQLSLAGAALALGGVAGSFAPLLYAGAALAALGLPLCLAYKLAAQPGGAEAHAAAAAVQQSAERADERLAASERALESLRPESTPWLTAEAVFPPSGEALDRAASLLEEQSRALALAERDRNDLAQAEAALALARSEARSAEEAFARAEADRDRAAAGHARGVTGLGLTRAVPPEEVKALFEAIGAALVRDSAAREAGGRVLAASSAVTACFALAASHPFFATSLRRPEADSGAAPSWPVDPAALEQNEGRTAAKAGLEALARAMTALDALREQEQERRRCASILCERQEARERVARRLALARDAGAEAARSLEEARETWRVALARFDLREGVSPDGAAEALALMREITLRDKDIHAARERVAALERALADFTGEIVALAAAMGIPAPPALDLRDVAPPSQRIPTALGLLDTLVARAEEAAGRAAQLADRREQRARQAQELEGAREALALTEAALNGLLRSAGTGDVECFRAAFARHSRTERLIREERALRDSLQRLAEEEGLSFEALTASLAQSSPEALQRRQNELAEALAAKNADMTERVQCRGALLGRRESLAGHNGDGGSAELRRREAGLKEKLRRLSRQWAVPALARELLLAAKERFEKEGRQGVLRHAGDMFCAVTGGEYTGIALGLDGESFTAVHRSGDLRDPEKQLSQGTREQLYLCLRLAFIKNHADKAEPMPVFMDDILVNFDPERAAATAGILAEFAGENQLLFFTCHPPMAQALIGAADNTSVRPLLYRIDRGVLSPA